MNTALTIILFTILSLPAWVGATQPTDESTVVVPIKGEVRHLEGTQERPDLLVALFGEQDKVKGPQPGLHVFSLADQRNPRMVGYLPIEGGMSLRLTAGGMTAVVRSMVEEGENRRFVIRLVDLSNPSAPLLVATVGDNVDSFVVSRDGKRLVLAEDPLGFGGEDHAVVYDIATPREPHRLGSFRLDLSPTDLELFRDGRCLLVRGSSHYGQVYDLSSPQSPIFVTHLVPVTLPGRSMIEKPGSVNKDQKRYGACSITPEMFVSLDLDSSLSEMHVSADGQRALVPSHDKKIAVYDLTQTPPLEVDSYHLEDYPHSVYQGTADSAIYAGTTRGIVVLAPHTGLPSAEELLKAHQQALRAYSNSSRGNDYGRSKKVLAHLEAAGVRRIIDTAPQGMNLRQHAHILNDYAFIKLNEGIDAKDAIQLLRRVILIDPSRAVAYLNLADGLRTHVFSGTLEEKRSITVEIITLYNRYIQLTGRSTPSINAFLRMNLLNATFRNVCDYVAAYVNDGRAKELVTWVPSIDLDGDGKMEDVTLRCEGTAHICSLIVIDRKTGSEEALEPADGDFDDIGLVQFGDRTYVLYSSSDRYPNYIGMVRPDLSEEVVCRFRNTVTEEPAETPAGQQFCASLLKEKPEKRFLPFEEGHSVGESNLNDPEEQYHTMEPTGARTLDFDNDGKRESLLRVEYGSGAGAGCGYSYFELLNSRKDGIVTGSKGKLLRNLQRLTPGEFHPVPYCRGNTGGWFVRNGRTYFENMYFSGSPRSKYDEFHEVSFVDGKGFSKACKFRFTTKTSVVQPEKKKESRTLPPGRIDKLKKWASKAGKELLNGVRNR